MAIKYNDQKTTDTSKTNASTTSTTTNTNSSNTNASNGVDQNTTTTQGTTMNHDPNLITASNLFGSEPRSNNPYQPDTPSQARGEFSWVNLSEVNRGLSAPSDSSSNLTSLAALFKEALSAMDTTQAGIDYEVLTIDKKNIYELQVSAIILVMTHHTNPDCTLNYRALVLESSLEMNPRTEIIDNQQYELHPFACDYVDNKFNSIIANEVRRQYPGRDIFSAGSEVIYKDLNLDTDRETLGRLILNAGGAAVVNWQNEQFIGLIDLSKHVGQEELSQHVVYSKEQKVDAARQPLRADIQLSVMASKLITDNYGRVRLDSRQQAIGSATGYIDLIYNYSAPEYGPQLYGQLQPQIIQCPTYTANFVLTSLELKEIKTLPGLLTALINVSFIREQNHWLSALMPNQSYSDKDMHDIGAIGYDIDIFGDGSFSRLNTAPTNFEPSNLGELYNLYFHKGLAISIDVPLCGSQTWQYKDLLAAADGDQGAINGIIEAADYLTGGKGLFKDIYYNQLKTNLNSPVFARTNKVLLGHYTSKDYGERDIRDLDYLAVSNFAGERGNKEEIHRYSDAVNGTYDQIKSDNIIHNLLSTYLGNVTLTGYAKRIYFDGSFVEALVMAAKACNYKVSGSMPYSEHHKQSRAVGDWVTQSVVSSNNSSGIFTGNSRQYNRNNSYNKPRF